MPRQFGGDSRAFEHVFTGVFTGIGLTRNGQRAVLTGASGGASSEAQGYDAIIASMMHDLVGRAQRLWRLA